MSRYRLKLGNNELVVVNEHRTFRSGSIRYEIRDYEGERIGVAGSLDEAVTALSAHLATNPPHWEEGGSGRYRKTTPKYCDFLVVERNQVGRWTALRNDYELADGNGTKTFRTAKDAQRAADLHADDGRPNAKPADDGLRWSGPSDPAEELEDRLHIEHFLGETVADAAEAIARASAEHSNGCIQLSTVRAIKDLIRILNEMRAACQFGSYDAESGARDPYFVMIAGAALSRVSFEEAAYHYGKLALREQLGPDLSDTTLSQMISDVLVRLPAPDLLRKLHES